MEFALIIIALIFLVALGLHIHKVIQRRQAQRIVDNEYNVAVVLWEFGRSLRGFLETARRNGNSVIAFNEITIPHSTGYRLTLELAGYRFRVYGLPDLYNRTGRLSFLIDDTLTVRASDRNGDLAKEEDEEYVGGKSE